MASGVLKRTAFIDNSKGFPIFHDYCLVTTSLGTCIEFEPPFTRDLTGKTQFNPADESEKVHEIVSLSLDQRPAVFKDEAKGIMLQEVGANKTGY